MTIASEHGKQACSGQICEYFISIGLRLFGHAGKRMQKEKNRAVCCVLQSKACANRPRNGNVLMLNDSGCTNLPIATVEETHLPMCVVSM